MKQKVCIMIALLCAVVQGAWADQWDGHTEKKPIPVQQLDGDVCYFNVVMISSAAEMAYVWRHFTEQLSWDEDDYGYRPNHFYEANFYLETDIDMGDAVSWTALGNDNGSITNYTGTFYGNGHTIRIHSNGEDENYQGLFARIDEGGCVQGIHLTGNISCDESRLVGGIAGENLGTIRDCWVNADVSSNWKNSSLAVTGKVGGIAGENQGTIEYCCMAGNVTNHDADVGGIVGFHNTGSVRHCTFYGTRNSSHSQDNVFIGDEDGSTGNLHSDDLLDDNSLNTYLASFQGNDVYRYAVQYPYAISVEDEGYGAVVPSATASRSGKTITLTIHPTPGVALRNFTVKDAEGNDISLNGNDTDGYTFTMPKRDVNIKTTYVFGGGSGTSHDPYLIKNSAHWDQLVADVAAGSSVGAYYRLDADISITTMVGSDGQPFNGHFDGNGHKLTVDYHATEQYTAPFRYAENYQIYDLTIAGTITTSQKFAAGLVAVSKEGGSITNCRSSVTINSSITGEGSHSGFVGYNSTGLLSFEGCVFDGNLLGSQTTSCCGFVGWNPDPRYTIPTSRIAIKNSIFAPQRVESGLLRSFAYSEYTTVQTFNFDNCYETKNFKGSQGKLVFSIRDDGNVSIKFKDASVKSAYHVSGAEFYDKALKFDNILYGPDDIQYSFELTHIGTAPEGQAFSYFNSTAGPLAGNNTDGYKMKMPPRDVVISAVYEDASAVWSGSGDGESPETAYIIDTPERWNEFVANVNNGNANGKYAYAYYQLAADITVTTMAGTDENKFQGHFDGNSRTLTLDYGTEGEPFAEDYCAPFRYVNNADIHNLIITGTSYTAERLAAGMIGYSVGITHITDCRVSVAINSSYVGDGVHGGFVSTIQSGTVNLTNCAFNGQLLGPSTNQCGGFVGWTEVGNSSTVNFSNCLFAPSALTVSTDGGATFARGNFGHQELGIDDCFYTISLGDIQFGTLAYADYSSEVACKEHEIAGVKFYLPAEIVTDVTATDILPFSAIVSWKGDEEYTYQVRYRKSFTKYFTSFEGDEDCEGWSFIDADKDGFNWNHDYFYYGSSNTHTGNGYLSSSCYDYNEDGYEIALTPDNWAVSPRLNLGGTLKVWLKETSDESDQHHFAIYLNTADNKFVGDDGQPVSGLIELVPETEATTEYVEYTADLSSYSGKPGYIAIRHFNSTDKSSLILDDFEIYDETIDNSWTTVDAGDEYVATITGLEPFTAYEYEVIYKVGNAEFYTPTARLNTMPDDLAPADLSVTDVTSSTATIGWTGYSGNFNLRYSDFAGQTARVTLNIAQNLWDQNDGYQMLLDIDHNTFGTIIPANSENELTDHGDAPEGMYEQFEYKIPENADGSTTTENIVKTGSVTIEIPAGIYDWCIANPKPEGHWIEITGDGDFEDNVFGRQNDFAFEGGKHYTFTVSYYEDQQADRVDMTVEDISEGGATSQWTTVNGITDTSYTLSGLQEGTFYKVQVQTVKDDRQSEWTDAYFITMEGTDIQLVNDGDNSDIIAAKAGKVRNVILAGRTLYKDGSWNTLCLPFDVSDLTGTPLEGATLKELGNRGCNTGFDASTGTLTLDFVSANSIEAGHAYLVKWDTTGDPIVNPSFNDVTIEDENPEDQKVVSQDGCVSFVGSYSSVALTGGDRSVLYLGSNNKLYFPTVDMTMGACRAYFKLNLSNPNVVKSFVLNFNEDDVTGIGSIQNQKSNVQNEGEVWYDLSGRKLNGKPTKRGIYIFNGRKEVMK